MFKDSRYLSFLITLFSMSIVILSLYNIHIGSKEKKEEYVVELAMLEEEEILEEEVQKEEQEQANQQEIKSHLAYNEKAKPTYGNPEPLKTLEELMEEATSDAESDPNSKLVSSENGYAASLKQLAKKREEAKQKLGEKDAKKDEVSHNLAKRKTSISYSLVKRNAYDLPPPTYTCIEGGKVVVNIEVDNLGNVVDAQFNKKSSGTSNGCLVENAIEYALKAQFNSSTKESQKGTITYLFQGK
ncbi:energy transducer TonB [Cellulophaga sp. 20_2_10]|uniref:energy transducer TonB family protein n=1 Tax=Cellulophaga sp. 20_2_10 TaxID=2942476 RepID=UPI00201B075F|nr:energy transducer TonB [Cellulophaga sp. 20_2_10]MCL5247251.1 energy transducer TonB [Cellulophaga sp. 20_2_10]